MHSKPITIPKLKGRSALVPAMRQRSGAGKHHDKRLARMDRLEKRERREQY